MIIIVSLCALHIYQSNVQIQNMNVYGICDRVCSMLYVCTRCCHCSFIIVQCVQCIRNLLYFYEYEHINRNLYLSRYIFSFLLELASNISLAYVFIYFFFSTLLDLCNVHVCIFYVRQESIAAIKTYIWYTYIQVYNSLFDVVAVVASQFCKKTKYETENNTQNRIDEKNWLIKTSLCYVYVK